MKSKSLLMLGLMAGLAATGGMDILPPPPNRSRSRGNKAKLSPDQLDTLETINEKIEEFEASGDLAKAKELRKLKKKTIKKLKGK